MADKDPKDMTASELLRWAANGEPNEYGYAAVSHKLFAALGGKPYSETTYDDDAQNICALADKIDAEIEAARCTLFKYLLDSSIELHGYPSRRKREPFERWLERCFIQRPLDEKGEPVQFGDTDIDWENLCEDRGWGMPWVASAVDVRGHILATTADPYEIVAVAKTDERGRVKRPAPEVLGFDGKPVVAGETVWDTESGKELSVCAIANADAGMIQCSDDTGDCEDYDAQHLIHTPPDTQERIDEDARKYVDNYWGCADVPCGDCNVKIDGKTPAQRYNAPGCETAKVLDLLRRQRELDKRTGGE